MTRKIKKVVARAKGGAKPKANGRPAKQAASEFQPDRLKLARAVSGATLDHVVNATGSSRTVVWGWENGTSGPSEAQVRKLERHFLVSRGFFSRGPVTLRTIDRELDRS